MFTIIEKHDSNISYKNIKYDFKIIFLIPSKTIHLVVVSADMFIYNKWKQSIYGINPMLTHLLIWQSKVQTLLFKETYSYFKIERETCFEYHTT